MLTVNDLKKITLYHGSTDIIKKPLFGKGVVDNDYGQGFYCTQNIELAKEWACHRNNKTAVVNAYTLDIDKIPNAKILSLYSQTYNVLNYIALLVNNRTFSVEGEDNNYQEEIDYLKNNFLLDVNAYDIIQGHRADDRYFTFVREFIQSQISVEKLEKIMNVGDLGEQIVIKSQNAFDSLIFSKEKTLILSESERKKYTYRKNERDKIGRNDYNKEKKISESYEITLKKFINSNWNDTHLYYKYITKNYSKIEYFTKFQKEQDNKPFYTDERVFFEHQIEKIEKIKKEQNNQTYIIQNYDNTTDFVLDVNLDDTAETNSNESGQKEGEGKKGVHFILSPYDD